MTPMQEFEMMGMSAMGLFPLAVMVFGVFSTIFWMVCAWRAMRAHEKIAESVERIGNQQGR
jgi:hypothetical protein